MSLKKIVIFILVISLASYGAMAAARYSAARQKRVREERARVEARKAAWRGLSRKLCSEIRSFKGRSAIVVKDLGTGWEMRHNPDRAFPSASLVKIPVMAACFEAADRGRIRLGQGIGLKSSDKFTGSGDLKDMKPGTVITVGELIGLMIYDSDNTAANMLTSLLGMDYLNKAFMSFGLAHTDLARRIADYRARDKGVENYTTASDMAMLLDKMYGKILVNARVSDQCVNVLKMTRTKDRIPKRLPAGAVVAHKTGLERGVCHDAGIVFTPYGDFIIVALTKHSNSTAAPSKAFIASAARDVYDYFEKSPRLEKYVDKK